MSENSGLTGSDFFHPRFPVNTALMTRVSHRFAWFASALATTMLALVAMGVAQLKPSTKAHLHGIVVDQSGAVVPGARIVLAYSGFQATAISSADGQFEFAELPFSAEGMLIVEAPGFAVRQQAWSAMTSSSPLKVVLSVASTTQEVSVTATRTQLPVSETAASVQLISHAQLASMGGLTLDDVLRQVPGFTLFRRSGSLTANPTSQGVSLRGLGASGASRALVLYDGIPLNDPFGGWVYWSRVPLISISSVEVMRGGASDLYGTDALSGVVSVLPRPATEDVMAVDGYLGTLTTADGSLFASKQLHNWAAAVTGDAFHSDGYVLVRDQDRGAVDTPASTQHRTGNVTLERRFSGANRAYMSGWLFQEARNNGTVLQTNSTHTGELTAGADWAPSNLGSFTTRTYFISPRYLETFSSVSADRNSESLVRSQTVPAQRLGFSQYWRRPVHSAHTLVAGVEVQDTRGHSNEVAFNGGRAVTRVDSGGRQTVFGFFGEDVIRIGSRWLVTAGLRVDRWTNYDAFQNSFPLPRGTATLLPLPEHTQSAVSPRVAVHHQLNRNVSLAASAYWSFRAPTLGR